MGHGIQERLFPLKLRGTAPEAAAGRVREAIALVGLRGSSGPIPENYRVG